LPKQNYLLHCGQYQINLYSPGYYPYMLDAFFTPLGQKLKSGSTDEELNFILFCSIKMFCVCRYPRIHGENAEKMLELLE
jgi:hypothetical protein